jgi:hypothetical protein
MEACFHLIHSSFNLRCMDDISYSAAFLKHGNLTVLLWRQSADKACKEAQ